MPKCAEKRFCELPVRFRSHANNSNSDARMTSCGECKVLRIIQSLRSYAEAAVLAHNTECLNIQDKHLAKEVHEAKVALVEERLADGEEIDVDDIDEVEDIDVEAIHSDYNIGEAYGEEYLHPNMEKVCMACTDGGMDLDFDMDDKDGMIDVEQVLEQIDDIDHSDWILSDMEDTFKSLEIPLVRYRFSFTAGAGIRMHVKMTGHDVDYGKVAY